MNLLCCLLLVTVVHSTIGYVVDPTDLESNWIQIPTASGGLIWTHRLSVEAQRGSKWCFDTADVKFVFFTRTNDSGNTFTLEDVQLVDEKVFSSSRPTRIVIHGWLNNKNSPLNINIRETYLIRWDYNVIVVDWSICAFRLNYIAAASCVETVGKTLAKMLESLQERVALSLDDVYLIGHSLGAHVAGIAGKSMPQGKVATIFALDPALPLYSIDKPDKRIDVNDAHYVEIIHTNGGILGFRDPLGTADFYPNGGVKQPGCGFNFAGICAHSRAWQLFVESLIEPEENLLAEQINSLNELPDMAINRIGRVKIGGEPSNAGQACGLYYIDTNDHSPFFGPS